MNIWQSFIGSVMEYCSILLMMSLFSSVYTQAKGKFLLASVISAVATSCGEYGQVPILGQYILTLGVPIVLYTVMLGRKVKYTFFEFIFAMAMVIGIELFLIVLQDYFVQGELEVWHSFIHLIILLIICLSITQCKTMIRKFQAFYSTHGQIFYFVTISVFAVLFIELVLWNAAGEQVYDAIGLVAVFSVMWLIINLYLLKVLIADGRKNGMVNAYKQYEQTTERVVECLHSEKHEYNRHLQAILHLCEADDSSKSEIIDYIVSIRSNIEQSVKTPQVLQTGNGLIAGLIYAKQGEAIASNIRLIYVLGNKVPAYPCHNYELIEILGNLIDNALDYLRQHSDKAEREICVELGHEKSRVFIKVSNSYYEENPETMIFGKKGYTTKTDSGHGYGLYHVKQIVSKYKGEFHMAVNDTQLSISIYFNNSDGQSGSP